MMTGKDVDMDESDIYDLDYDELALASSKRRRRGSGSFSFSFTSCSSIVEPEVVLQGHSSGCCGCGSDDVMVDKLSSSTATLRFQCRLPAAKLRDPQASMDLGRAISFCHRYGAEIQVGPAYGERNPIIGLPSAGDRDKYKKWFCKNDSYEFRTSKYHQANSRSISFLDRLRAAQAASACTPTQCPET